MKQVDPSPERHSVLNFVTPGQDLVFWEKVDMKNQRVKDLAIDSPHWDTVKYPHHKLVFKAPLDAAGMWFKYYYAAKRSNQDAYNWTFTEGRDLRRVYLIRRDEYRQKPQGFTPAVANEFFYPPGATADSVFSAYGFLEDEVLEAPEELSSTFILVRRSFTRPLIENTQYDDTIERDVLVKRQLVPKGTTKPASTPGNKIEKEDGGTFHDWFVTSTPVLNYVPNPDDPDGDPILETFPIQMTSLIGDVNFKFPELIDSARFIAAWALADSTEAARSYDEAWYLDLKRRYPAPGPFEARFHRFLCTDPNALRADFPLTKVVSVPEVIAIARAWAYASTKGNSTMADARPLEVPPTIHAEIKIENGDTLSVGQSTNTLPATPGYAEFVGSASHFIGYESQKVGYGLYIVTIIEINATGVYNGVVIPFGTKYEPGVGIPDMGAGIPPIVDTAILKPTGTFSADNKTLTGITSPNATVKVFNGTKEVGRGGSNANGQYSLLMDLIYIDPTSLTAYSYVNGRQSQASTLVTNDLKPERPSAWLPTGGTTLQGTTDPGNTVTILANAQGQIETARVDHYYHQEVKMYLSGAVTTAGALPIQWTSALVNDTVEVDAEVGDAGLQLAEKYVEAFANSPVNEFWEVTASSGDLTFTCRQDLPDDPTAAGDLTDPNGTGFPLTGSTQTRAGQTDLVTISTAGTVILEVSSGIAPFTLLDIPAWVDVGSSVSDVLDALLLMFNLSEGADYYAGSTGSGTLSLQADPGPTDPSFNVRIKSGTAVGLIDSPAVSEHTSSGTPPVTITVGSTGAFTYTFPVALVDGNLVSLYASDGGGAGDSLTLEYDASPPELLTTATLSAPPNSDTITGTATASQHVIAYVGNDEVGTATVSGGGSFTLTMTRKMVKGEVIQLVPVMAANHNIRGVPQFLTATDLDLEIPVFERTDVGYVGTTPAGVTSIIITRLKDSSTTTATLHANGTFSFTTIGEAGEGYDVFARYPNGDSDKVRFFIPTLPKMKPLWDMKMGWIRVPTFGSPPACPAGYKCELPWIYRMSVMFRSPVAITKVTLSFPGTTKGDIVITNPQNGKYWREDAGAPGIGVAWADISYPYGQNTSEAIYGVLTVPFVGSTINPYDTVKIVVEHSDGDVSESTWNKNSYTDVIANSFWKPYSGWQYSYFGVRNRLSSSEYYTIVP